MLRRTENECGNVPSIWDNTWLLFTLGSCCNADGGGAQGLCVQLEVLGLATVRPFHRIHAMSQARRSMHGCIHGKWQSVK